MQPSTLFVGVDISKAELVICIAGQRPCSIANDAASIRAWLRTAPAHALIAMESTGRYHALLAQLAYQAGLQVYVLNARDVFFYARALGTRAKTDAVDAVVIARYLEQHHAHLHPWHPGSATQQQLQELLVRRAQVVAHRTALTQAFVGVQIDGAQLAGLNAAFQALLKSIDAQVQRLIDSDARMARGYRLLLTITGIGPQSGALLTTLFSRLEFANADALVGYSGLDPRPNDSGTRHGRRRLSKKGPALLRRQMWLAGFSASRSKLFAPWYQTLRAKGFASTEAIVIMGRKLLRVAFAVWKSDQAFDSQKLGPKSA